MISVLDDKHFHNEAAAYRFVEARIWPNGPVCPRCGETKRVGKMGGQSTRIGTYKCYACRKPFTVKVGTVFESSHVPLRHWLQAIFLLSSSKKGISSNQLARTLGCTLKTAWFISHRVREAMKIDGSADPLGGAGKIIESDETFWGPKDVDTDPAMKARRRGKPGSGGKSKIFTLVERGGRARSFKIADATNETLAPRPS
jgi:transposase-like protein